MIERNQDLITKRLDQIDPDRHSYHYIDDQVRDCISEIATREGRSDLAPKYEYLSQWSSRPNLPDDFRQLKGHLLAVFGDRHKYLTTKRQEEDDQRVEQQTKELTDRNTDLIHKFLEITERKVSILDDYGDENWSVVPREIDICLQKVGEREGLHFNWSEYTKSRRRDGFRYSIRFTNLPKEYRRLGEHLEKAFHYFHVQMRSKTSEGEDVSQLSGIEFETHVAKLLRSRGYDVSGTPATGDQGADLIAKKDGRTVVIQAKRYQGTVGNKAVQETIAAVQYYGADEGWVVTNSTFTPSAKALAQRSNIRLVDSAALQDGFRL